VVAQQAHDNTPPADLSQAHAAIQALQAALRASWAREEQLQIKLRQSADRANSMVQPQPGDTELDRNEEAESGFTGVTRNKAGWAAHTKRKRGVRKHLGTHDTPVEAARARRDYYSEFVAAVNQVPQGLSVAAEWHRGAIWGDRPNLGEPEPGAYWDPIGGYYHLDYGQHLIQNRVFPCITIVFFAIVYGIAWSLASWLASFLHHPQS
jgi:hypothetical protein